MSERLMEYLEVDPETVEPYTPEWPTEAVLRPVPEAAELLPHLAHSLAPVRVRGSADPTADAPVALATSPWLPIEDAADPENTVPNPDTDPLSAGTAVLTPASYENRLQRTTTARGDLDVVVLADSPDRAAAIRRVLSNPATPDGINTWKVLDRPDAEQTAAVLSNPDIDIVYCELPTKGDRIAAGSEMVELDGLGGAPALTVFEGTEETRLGVSVVENGGLSSIVAESVLDPPRIRRLLGLLAVGVPVAASVGLSEGSNGVSTRLIGDPSMEVASRKVIPKLLVSAAPGDSDDLPITRVSLLSMPVQIGSEGSPVVECFSNRLELMGTQQVEKTTVKPAVLIELLNEDDSILQLNGTVILESDNLTEADIEKVAKQNSADDVQATEIANWYSLD